MRYLIILNPGSRSGKGKKLWDIWLPLLKVAQIDFEVVITKSLEHANYIAKNAINFDVIVAVGGDGTINRVINGVLLSKNPNRGVGILYAGTSPDFCKFHKIPLNPTDALDALLSGKKKLIDVAKITYSNANNEYCYTGYFVCSCNIGMGASIARQANKWRKYFGDICGTALASLYTIIKNNKLNLSIEYNNQLLEIPNINNVSIIINPYLASGIKLNLSKEPDDSQLVLFVMKNRNLFTFIHDLPKLYDGTIIEANDTFLTSCKKVNITAKNNQEIEFDGDPQGFLPLTVEIQPKKLKLLGCGYA